MTKKNFLKKIILQTQISIKKRNFSKKISLKRSLIKKKKNLDLQIIQNTLTKKILFLLHQMKIKKKVNSIEKKDLKKEKDQKNFLLKNIIKKIRIIFLLHCIQNFELNDLPVKV